jgi:hypothetical protein
VTRTLLSLCGAALLALLGFRGVANAQATLTADEARAIVAPLYAALNQPAKKGCRDAARKGGEP